MADAVLAEEAEVAVAVESAVQAEEVGEIIAEGQAAIEAVVDEVLDAVQAAVSEPSDEAMFIAELTRKRHQLKEAERREDDAAEALKSAKKKTEAIQDELNEMIDEFENRHNNPQLSLPFGKPSVAKPAAEEDTLEALLAKADARSIADTKLIRISDLDGLTEKMVDSLVGAGIVTVGDFCNQEQKYQNGPDWLVTLPGIARSKADKIRDLIQDLFVAKSAEARAKASAEWEAAKAPTDPPAATAEDETAVLLDPHPPAEVCEDATCCETEGVSE